MAPTDDQQDLIQTIHDVLLPDPDILAAWLSGSLGAGSGDAFSDVDVLLLAPSGEAGTVARRYAEDLSPIAETVIVNRLGNGRVVNAVKTDWRRFDLTFIEEAELAFYDRARLSPLFNKTEAEPPIAERRPYKTDPQDLSRLVTEFFRVLGLSVVGLGRDEYLVALQGVGLLSQMTIDLMLEVNGVGPADRGGALKRNPLLLPEQRAALEAIHPVAPTRAGIIAANMALANLFVPLARRHAEAIGMDWLAPLEAATKTHLWTHLQATYEG